MDEEKKETSAAIAGLLSLLKSIEVTPERIAQNQWKSVNKNEVSFRWKKPLENVFNQALKNRARFGARDWT